MKGLLNILFLMTVSVSFAQKKYAQFSFESAETGLIGDKVKMLDKELFGVFIPREATPEKSKIIVDQKGIYFLNDKNEAGEFFYSASNADHILYNEEGHYWLFKKQEDGTFTLYQLNISRKEYKYKAGWWEPVLMDAELVEELLDYYKAEKIKVKFKDDVLHMKELDEEMLVYVEKTNPEKVVFDVDQKFSVYIKSPDCVEGNLVETFEENQYDELSLNLKGELKNTGLMDKLVIDATGMYSTDGDKKFYVFKPDDPNYVLKKIDNYGYVALIKMENEFYHLLIIKPSNRQINFLAIKESHDHGFYSDSEHRVDQGERLYLLCDLTKYLKFGVDKANSYNGNRMHW